MRFMIKLVWGVKKMKRKNENKLFIIFITIKRILLGIIFFIICTAITALMINVILPFIGKYIIVPLIEKYFVIILIVFLSFGFLCLLYSIGKAIEPKIKKKR